MPANTTPIPLVTSEGDDAPAPGIALSLSGGGFRAMLFHLGVIWRLNDMAFLPRLNRVSSVSGGSITAGLLGLRWAALDFDSDGKSRKFDALVTRPLRALANERIHEPSIVRGLLSRGTVGDQVAQRYEKHLYGAATLQDLPDDAQGPRFVINATNLQSGRLWRFSKPYMADYLVGLVDRPTVKIADAVAASSAFPPFLSPFHLSVPLDAYKTVEGNKLTSPEYRKKVYLSDGGVYDNLGIETTWKNFQTILVSDAGGRMGGNAKPPGFWLTHTKHVLDVIDNQVRSLRRKQVVQSFKNGEREGAYWSTYGDLTEYRAQGLLPCPFASTQKLARVKTGLTKLDERTQEQLINWGYAACDAGVRSYVDKSLPPPVAFPYPNAGV